MRIVPPAVAAAVVVAAAGAVVAAGAAAVVVATAGAVVAFGAAAVVAAGAAVVAAGAVVAVGSPQAANNRVTIAKVTNRPRNLNRFHELFITWFSPPELSNQLSIDSLSAVSLVKAHNATNIVHKK